MSRRWIAVLASAVLPLGLLVAAPGAAQSAPVEPRVVNGRPPSAGEFGFLAAVRSFPGGGANYYSCGGAFVSPTQVVTAAHCFYDAYGTLITTVKVGPAAGTAQPTSFLDATVDVHEDYDPQTAVNDIALLTLPSPLLGVSVASVPSPSQWQAMTSPGAAVQSAGWGSTFSGGSVVPNFRVADLTVIPDSVCGDASGTYSVGSVTYQGLGAMFDSLTMICAGGATSSGQPVDTCQGDSGGPLTASSPGGARLVGIVSWGIGCAGVDDGRPVPLTPGVYTRLGNYLGWLADRGVTPQRDVSVPGQVRGFSQGRYKKSGATYRVTVKWRAPADTGGATITGYEARLGLRGQWSSWSSLDSASTLLTRLAKGKKYVLQVRALNEAGAGPHASYSLSVPRR